MVHDESTDLRLLSKIAKINYGSKTISIPRSQVIGNKRWGRIDFLTHYRGWHLVQPDNTVVTIATDDASRREKKDKRKTKKMV